MPRVSILISVFNSKLSLLKEVIEAIKSQTYKDVEIVVVNDGSTDKAVNDFLYSLQESGNIKLIVNTENKGLIYSLNRGIKYCDGYYIARFDDDDIPLVDRLKLQIEYLELNPDIDAIGGWANIVNELGGILNCKKYPRAASIKRTIAFRSPISHSLLVFKKSLVENLGGYDKSFKGAEDYALFLKMKKNGCQLDNIQQVLGSQKFTYNDANKRDRTTRLSVLKAKIKFFDSKNMLFSTIGILFSFVWFSLPQKVINYIYKRDIDKGILYD